MLLGAVESIDYPKTFKLNCGMQIMTADSNVCRSDSSADVMEGHQAGDREIQADLKAHRLPHATLANFLVCLSAVIRTYFPSRCANRRHHWVQNPRSAH